MWCMPKTGKPTILYIDLHLVHEVTSAQAFEGLRLAGRKVRQPGANRRHAGPQHSRRPIARCRSSIRFRSSRSTRCGRNCREFGVKLYDLDNVQPGHRPRHRSRTGPDAAGHDDRLRRQPHGHARGVRCHGLRHRHQRSRTRAGDADAVAISPQDIRGPLRRARWPAASRPRI